MRSPMPDRQIARFGVFEFDTATGELRKHGVIVKLRGKPLQILQILIAMPGEVVSREELQRKLWSSDVFVDFDNGLNTAANRLRIALGDSADNPRYIETLARTGYRFIAPLQFVTAPPADTSPPRGRRWLVPAAIATAAVLILGAAGTWLALRRPSAVGFEFRQLTFRRGQVGGARFAPDGRAILYSATWGNSPRQLFMTNPASPESRLLGFDRLGLMSVSRSGELALVSSDGTLPIAGSTLSRVPMNGGAPLPIERNVMSADWAPDGSHLAIAHAIDGVNQLEFPMGTLLEKTSGWIANVRVSPDGERVAFIEHPVRNDTRGSIKVAEPGRLVRALTGEWSNVGGLAWQPSGREVWFTASRGGAPKSLWAVTLSGTVRPVSQIAGTMTLRDIAPDGDALLSREIEQLEMSAVIDGESSQRSLSWLDWSRVADVSTDGNLVLFDESGLAVGSEYAVYVHRMSDNSTMRLGAGTAMALTPDGKFALVQDTKARSRLRLLPFGAGTPIQLPAVGLEYQWVRYFPDGKRLLALASEPGRPLRLYVQPPDRQPYPITPPTVARNVAISPDGMKVAVFSANTGLAIYPTSAQGEKKLVQTTGSWAPLLWTRDDTLYVEEIGAYTQIPTRISRLRLPSGQIEPWKEIAPVDAAGVNAITKVMLSADSRTLIFNYRRVVSELFIAEPSTR